MNPSSLEQKKTAWCQPISETSFGGEPSRYDEKYEKLLTEIAKLESVHGLPCDWDEVYSCADYLLSQKTKDLTVIGALCMALYKRARFEGLAAGLEAYHWLLENHSQDMFPNPQRQRGRAGAYTWLTERLIKELELIEQEGPKAEEHLALKRCQEAFNGLDGLLYPQLGNMHPRVGPITRLLGNFIERSQPSATSASPEPEPIVTTAPLVEPSLPAEPSREEPPTPTTLPPPMTPPPAGPPPGRSDAKSDHSSPNGASSGREQRPLTSPGGTLFPPERIIESKEQAAALLEVMSTTLKKLSLFYLEQEEHAPLGYHLAHLASFLGVVPDGDRAGGRPPSPRKMRELQAAAVEKNWSGVIQIFREILTDGDMNLNAAYYLAQALEGLGHEMALATVNGHALGLYQQMGNLLDFSPDTADWLEGLRSPLAKSLPDVPQNKELASSELNSESDNTSGHSISQIVEQAKKQIAREDFAAGCQVIQMALKTAATASFRFQLRLALANLCLDEHAADLARPILQDLQKELEGPIRNWQTGLWAEVLTALLSANRQLEKAIGEETDSELEKDIADLMTQLARVDIQAAYRMRMKE